MLIVVIRTQARFTVRLAKVCQPRWKLLTLGKDARIEGSEATDRLAQVCQLRWLSEKKDE
jgi:hypothetical protein